MRYVTLAPQYVLRGWCDMKYALYNWDSWGGEPNKVVPLTPLQMQAIELITSKGVSMDDKILPKSFRNAAEKLLNRKILVECAKDEGLTEFQKYKYSTDVAGLEDGAYVVFMKDADGAVNSHAAILVVDSDGGSYMYDNSSHNFPYLENGTKKYEGGIEKTVGTDAKAICDQYVGYDDFYFQKIM